MDGLETAAHVLEQDPCFLVELAGILHDRVQDMDGRLGHGPSKNDEEDLAAE